MKNWVTTIGGILGAIGVAGSQVPSVPEEYRWIFAVVGAAGVALAGVGAKDFCVHSTSEEVHEATVKDFKSESK